VTEAPARLPPPARHSSFVYGLSKGIIWCWCKVWLRLRAVDARHVPRQGPVLLVANHTSYLDPLLLGSAAPRRVNYLAQAGLARFGPLRWWLCKVGVSLIDRRAPSKDVLRHLAEALERGSCVGLFAEGTRSDDGSVGPFRSGVEFLVRRTGATVVPSGIDGAFRSFSRGRKWPRPARCTVRFSVPWPAERVLQAGGVEALRAEVARLARRAAARRASSSRQRSD
jgi:1-acyl-sn-glycerol-3-phosphate acyltransferase